MALKAVQPEHIPPERIGNKADVASWFGVSLTTVDQWLRRGCPYMQRGERGKQWQFDLLGVAKWKYGAPEDGQDDDPEKLSPKERLDWYRGETERVKLAQAKGELIPAAQYEADLADALKRVATGLESLPDVLERDVGIGGAAVERTIAAVDAMREDLFKALTHD